MEVYNHFYVYGLYLTEDSEKPIAYKIGITSYPVEEYTRKRYSELTHKLIYCYSGNKYIVRDIEKYIKKIIPGRYLSKEIYGNGWTETIKPSMLPYVTKIICEILN